ncbi:MAG: hypothetical protein ACR2Q4_23240 [Geminicoccaceae bacterium]
MLFRSVVLGVFVTASVMPAGAWAQVLLCPESQLSIVDQADTSAEAERLLQRLSIGLDLHGHRGVDEGAIMQAHEDTPGALLAKLNNVADRCASVAGPDIEAFQEHLPDLRRAFLQATSLASLEKADAEGLEQSIDLSVRELWRKLWFRRGGSDVVQGKHWAVIVASPEDADSGWDSLGAHQHRWKDVYFQLHEPYHDANPHHAIVVGRRLPHDEAGRLLAYVKELGMADDAFLWPLPIDAVTVTPASASTSASPLSASTTPASNQGGTRKRLDLDILNDQ